MKLDIEFRQSQVPIEFYPENDEKAQLKALEGSR